MKVKKIAVYGTTAAIALATLTGCGEQTEKVEELTITAQPTKEDIFQEKVITDQLSEEITKGESKIFAPYRHLLFMDFNSLNLSLYLGNIEIPDGYEVLEIEASSSNIFIWFTNTVSVEVTAVYNRNLGDYDYSHFGVPIKTEKEKSIQKTK